MIDQSSGPSVALPFFDKPFGALGRHLVAVGRQADQWAVEHPNHIAVAAAVIGVGSAAVLNQVFMPKEGVATLNCLYGAIRGAAFGLDYPGLRDYARDMTHYAARMTDCAPHPGETLRHMREAYKAALG